MTPHNPDNLTPEQARGLEPEATSDMSNEENQDRFAAFIRTSNSERETKPSAVCPVCMGEGKLWCAMCGTWGNLPAQPANLSYANLSAVKADFLAAVLNLPNELEFLRDAIAEGRINGSSYSGDCACLAGTLARAKGIECYFGQRIRGGRTFTSDASSPRERFFFAIKTGDTPETNPASRIVLEWTDEAIAMRDNCRATAPRAEPPVVH